MELKVAGVAYTLLTWMTIGVHACFILFGIFGALIVWRHRRIALLHIPAVLWGSYMEFSGRLCPLTTLENRFRLLAGSSGYQEGFIEHYVLAVIYPSGLTVLMQYVLGSLLVLANAVAYLLIWRRGSS